VGKQQGITGNQGENGFFQLNALLKARGEDVAIRNKQYKKLKKCKAGVKPALHH
jgi:hypothetical protein